MKTFNLNLHRILLIGAEHTTKIEIKLFRSPSFDSKYIYELSNTNDRIEFFYGLLNATKIENFLQLALS